MEYKKIIAALRGYYADCSGCPYNPALCELQLSEDAADALELLTADNAAKDAEIARLREENRAIRGNSVSHEVYAAVAAERDAAVHDLRVCSIEGDMECNYCTGKRKAERCNGCRDGRRWKYLGTTSQDAKTEQGVVVNANYN